ncbi:hypothetical protein F2P56_013790 [Juglans regia]|uniref:Retrovirus-related Pol polyprotein from transposon TNT 1-94-like beta-barrel domain-containing protein n=1 Tax=Juglans regia TaxID=51240 RepID=A0A833XCC0_JUGRE|nr:hypothetical protein F2P56_013790 [Juglans regia]
MTKPRFNHNYQPDDVPKGLTAFTVETDATDTEWTTGTGASAHMTSIPGMLNNLRPYHGLDKVMLGDGTLLAITHIGEATLRSNSKPLTLDYVLLVPNLEKNLLSIRQLTSNHSLNFEFLYLGFTIKDRATNNTLLRGTKKG